jgi:uncharacterized protein
MQDCVTIINIMKFEWDTEKERKNIQKHGVTFEQAAFVFSDPYSLSKYDEEHSQDENRWILLGKSQGEVILVVIHIYRKVEGAEHSRIISARKATKNEQKAYQNRCPL